MGMATGNDVDLSELMTFAWYLTGDRAAALEQVRLALRSHPRGDHPALLGAVASAFTSLDRYAETTFAELEDILWLEPTQPVPPELVEHNAALLWRLKSTCLMSTLGCLSSGIRVAFVLHEVLQIPLPQVCQVLAIEISALRVRLTRARRSLDLVLSARCEHLADKNPCTCSGRLAIAVAKHFIGPGAGVVPPSPYKSRPSPHLRVVYQDLPRPALSVTERLELQQLMAA